MDEAGRIDDTVSIIEKMNKMYKLVNTDLYNRIEGNDEFQGMGTTLVMASIDNDKLFVGNVGDSRLYHIRDRITHITHDHTLAEDFVKKHRIERNSEAYNNYKNQLTRAIGGGNTIRPDFFEVDIMEGDYILMCSDGLYNMVDDANILSIINERISLEEKVSRLIDLANENGGSDNIACLVIYIESIDKKTMFLQEDLRKQNENYLPHIVVNENDINGEKGGLNI